MIGKLLSNRYEILELLGGGGMAVVYKGRDVFLNRLVTIKILRSEFTSDEDFIRRFQREAQAVASLSHPNIVNIYDVGREGDLHYLVMEYVEGENLKNVIKQKGRLSPSEAVLIARQVCEALQHAHERNIVHRDVKPHNILIARNGLVKLTDFGIAQEATAATLTQTGTIVGSVHYLSPEQASGKQASPKSDLYSAGVVLYEMLTGCQPFTGDSAVAVALKHIHEEPRPVVELNPEVPPELAAVVERAMEKDPDRRFASARQMAMHLQAALPRCDEQATVLLPADEMATRVLPTGDEGVRKTGATRVNRRWLWVLVAVLVLGLLAGGGYGFYKYIDVPEIRVPDVVGMPVEKARATLEEKGLTVRVREEHHPEIPAGHVIAQSIGADDPPVKLPREVTLTVSLGPELKIVPDLYGKSMTVAQALLEEEGLKLGEVVREYHSEVPAGVIFAQLPKPGSEVPSETAVKVFLSEGPPPELYEVPDLTGLTLEDARSRLAAQNLVLDEKSITWDKDNHRYMKGQVVLQDPPAGEKVKKGTPVRVTLSGGPGPSKSRYNVSIKDEIPADGKQHLVEIVVEDAEGRSVQYVGTHSYGEHVKKVVEYRGEADIMVYIDGELVRRETVSQGGG